jgi:hypothetical protein
MCSTDERSRCKITQKRKIVICNYCNPKDEKNTPADNRLRTTLDRNVKWNMVKKAAKALQVIQTM